MSKASWAQVTEALVDLDFPATKDEIVKHVEHRDGRSQPALGMLRALPLGTYRNISEIRSSVPLDTAAEEGQTPARQAEQARSHHTHRIAEHLRAPE